MTAQSNSGVPDEDALFTDVLIIGAGLSGIGAAYRIKERNPGLSYAILERRSRIGGTWDLFRYPGIRSDSDIFTLSYPFEPWKRPEAIADGEHIREYLTETARRHQIDRHITFDTLVRSADWDSLTDTWTVQAEQGGVAVTFSCRFLFFGTGYYNYDEGYRPEFPGETEFKGRIVHPQFWPEDLDYRDKKVVVIGSGATAITLVPAMAESAALVTMLQRSPTYIGSMSTRTKTVDTIRKVFPRRVSHTIMRWRNSAIIVLSYAFSRKLPETMKKLLRLVAVRNLPDGYDVDTHFKPTYQPWDQRMCAVPDGDIFKAISAGRAAVVTDRIKTFDSSGIRLESGERLDADIVVTATGLQLQSLGGTTVSVDGAEVKTTDRFVYKGHLLEDVPNLAWCVGYTNASWTMRSDMTAQAVAKLLAYMGEKGYTHSYPHLGARSMSVKPSWDIKAGYVQRNPDALPKSGTHRPWNVRQNYVLDAIDHRFDRIEEAMVFGRVDDTVTIEV
ncbi:NAD(P)/FAD-dependent oxidoreductase [Nocardia sp. 348MFTsu5.1]|uniref:flavin-containing monooxygenase n=1 Tax=Nocardia sp. 348MFTsu5.1 TaxID=1172185 RepID=UPI00037A5E53|nr:NAD(P)/FAD-dependent oxidoreductase [Nocardia sp. 348MFTsu5.1]